MELIMTEKKFPSQLECAASRKLSVKLVIAGEYQARCVYGMLTLIKFQLRLAQVCGLA